MALPSLTRRSERISKWKIFGSPNRIRTQDLLVNSQVFETLCLTHRRMDPAPTEVPPENDAMPIAPLTRTTFSACSEPLRRSRAVEFRPGWWNKRNKFCTTYNRKELLLRVVCRLFQLFHRQGHQTAWAARDFSLRLTRSGNSVLVRQGVSDATGVLSMVPDITADAARR